MTTVLPAWKKELIEKKKRKDKEEKLKLQDKSTRIDQIPEWKRTLIQKRGSQSSLLAGGVQQSSNSQNLSNGSVVHPKPWSPSSSFSHSEGSRYVIEHASSSEQPCPNKNSPIRSQEKGAPKENTNNREKNSLVTRCITNSVDSSSQNNLSGANEKPVIANAPAAEENVFSRTKVGFGKSNGSIVYGMNHADTKMDGETREGFAICSDKVKYEHVRAPSELRKMFEKPKAQSGGDRSGKSNERIQSYAKSKNNKETVSFKSGDVDRPATQIDQNRFKGSTDTLKLVEQKVPNSLQPSPKDSKQSENDYRTSANARSGTILSDSVSDTHDSKVSEKSKLASSLSTNVLTASAVITNTKTYPTPSHFAPKPYKSYSSSSRFPWMKSSSEVDKGKQAGYKSPASVSTDLNSTDIGTCKSEIRGDRMPTSQPTQTCVKNLECKLNQDSTSAAGSHEQSVKTQGPALTGSDGFKQKFIVESKTENVTNQDASFPQAKEKLKDSTKLDDFDLLHSKFDHGSQMGNDITLSQPIRDSGKIQSRPPPVRKRWSADVATMLSLQSQNEEPARHRSPSLGEISEENTDWSRLFRHRPSISEGIERRMSELKKQASHSEDDENQEENNIQSKPVELMEKSDHKQQESIRARPSSWTAPDDITFQPGGSQNVDDVHQSPKEKMVSDKTVLFAHKPSIGQSIERRVGELVRHSSTPDLLAALKDSEKQALDSMEPSPVVEEEIQSDVFKKLEEVPSDKVTVNGEAEEKVIIEEIVKPSKGSVHKLSALFGSSIFRGNKKEKLRTESKSETTKCQKIEKPEKVNKNTNLTQSKEEAKLSPSLFKKVFKSENKTKKVESNAKEVKDNAQPSKLSTSNKVDKKLASINKELEEPVSKPWPANELRHVQTLEKKKVEKKLSGKLVLMIDEDADDLRPGYHKRSDSEAKKSIHTRVVDFEKEETTYQFVAHQSENQNLSKDKLVKPNTLLSMNGIVDPTHNNSLGSRSTSHNTQPIPISSIDNAGSTQSDVSISVIDMPEQSKSDIEVSVIDVPRSPTPLDVEVSAIDLPESPEAPEVSVIDMPEPEESKVPTHLPHQLHVYDISDGSDDSGSDDETTGSYDITIDEEDNEPFIITEGKSFGDDGGIPVSSIDDTSPLKVPVVIFDVSPPPNLKSCICPKPGRKKSKPSRKISFQDNHTLHHYLSEDAMTAEFDQMELRKANESKMTLSSYQPASSTNYEKSLDERRHQENAQKNPKREETVPQLKPVPKAETRRTAGDKSQEMAEITYKDDGYGFTESSDNAGALLF